MENKLYSIKDDLAGAFMTPFIHNNDETAKRAIKTMLNMPGENEIKANYKDKQLYYVGEFDDRKGEITKTEKKFICNFQDLKEGE